MDFFDANGAIVLDNDGQLCEIDIQSGEKQREFKAEDASGCQVSPCQSRIVLWQDNAFSIYRIQSGEHVATFRFGNGIRKITTATWSEDSNALAIGGSDHSIYIMNLDVDQPQQCLMLMGHEDWIATAEFTSSDRLLTTDIVGQMRWWDLNSGSTILVAEGRGITISDDGRFVAGNVGASLVRWRVLDDRARRTGQFGYFPYEAYDMIGMSDREVAISCTNYGVDIWDLGALEFFDSITVDPPPTEIVLCVK